jgi:hypothetical protein
MDNMKMSTEKSVNRARRYSSLEAITIALMNSIHFPQEQTSLKINLQIFIKDILAISKYMFVLRYESAAPKNKRIVNTLIKSSDLLKFDYLDAPLVEPQSKKRIVPMDFIAAFKALEQYLYHEKFVSDDLDFELGSYSDNYQNIVRTLPTLLLESKSISDVRLKQDVLSLIHSLICIYRQFSSKSVPNIETITAPFSGNMSLSDCQFTYFSNEDIDSWLNRIDKFDSIKEYCRLHIYSGNASSPAGGSHDVNILQDVNSIMRDFPIRDAILKMATYFKGGEEFTLLIENLFANTAWDKTFPLTQASRLVTFTAPGGKARVIAIADWVSQTSLSAIHFAQFQLLKLISSDRTFSHKTGLDIYRDQIDNFYSLDLSAATDRFPRLVQSRIIARIFSKLGLDGDMIAQCWLTIIDRNFSTRGSYFEKQTSNVKYAVGNGMGLFSSWSTMALTHHYIVNQVCGVPNDDYRLVGDDLLIRNNKESYLKYLRVMADLGVGVNAKKTIVSEDKTPTIEFARNYVIQGCRIKPILFGVLFAWIDNNITSDTVVWYIRDWINNKNLNEILVILDLQDNVLAKFNIIYYMYRESILSSDEISTVLKSVSEFKKYPIDVLRKIKQVTASARLKITIKDKTIKGFYDTLLSQCIVRKPAELRFVVNFAQNIAMISFADERLVEPAEKFHRRMLDANLIRYDVDIKGGPLITKRERNLIKDILTRDKVIKQEDKALGDNLTDKLT